MIQRRVYPSADAVARALADALIEIFAATAGVDHPVAVMLAGGRTPKAAYQLVADSGRSAPPNLTLMISDERWVPRDHADSNYKMMSPFLDAVGALESQRLMVNTALPRDAAAADFGQRLDAFFAFGGKLAACFLGLGSDGHTASLFNPEHLRNAEGRSALDVDRPDGRVGISATPSIIRRAEKVVFVVTGSDKQEMAHRLLTAPANLTAGQVVWRHPNTAIWLDRETSGDPVS
jgi:6-phosphogluconolactonase